MGDLDRRASGHRVPVEAEQAVPAKDIQDGADPVTHRQQFASQHSPPDVVGIVTDRDQPEHHLTRRMLGEGIELAVEGLGAPGQAAARPPMLDIVVESYQPIAPPLVQLGEGVLQQRERAGVLGDVGHDLGHQSRLESDALRSQPVL